MDNLEILAGAVERLEAVLERIAIAQMKERLKAGFAQEK